MPLFHGNALMALWGPAVMVGAAIATRPRFSASAFIDDVRRYGATKFSYVGKAIAYILATPERPDDADNTLQERLRHRGVGARPRPLPQALRVLPH
jgi:fatty-acyl-CoA synthase